MYKKLANKLTKSIAYIHILRTDIAFINCKNPDIKFIDEPFDYPQMRPYLPYKVINVYEYKEDYDKIKYTPFNMILRNRYHRKRRIAKKWLHRYGFRKMPCLIKLEDFKKQPLNFMDVDGDIASIIFAKEEY